MRVNNIETIIPNDDYNNSEITPIDYGNPILSNNTGSGSQIIEPEIVIPISTDSGTNNNYPKEQIDVIETVLNQQQEQIPAQTGTSTVTEPNINSEPSATTDENKTYVGGGTTPDSNIVVNKPKPNYLMYGLIGVVGLAVVYKLFLSKKKE